MARPGRSPEPAEFGSVRRAVRLACAWIPLLLLFVPLALAGRSRAEMPEAPDGHPGLGFERDARELAKYLRKPPKKDRKFLESWAELPGDVQVLWNEYLRDVRKAKLFLVLDEKAGDPTLAELFDAWRAAAADLPAALADDQPHAELLARLHVDLRFRWRAELYGGFALERQELMAGLAVLNGMNDGFVVLGDSEAQEISARVDLAAARLRSMLLDLDALSKAGGKGPGSPTDERIAALLSAARDVDAGARTRRLAAFEAKLEQTRERLVETLFVGPLARELEVALLRREASIQDAAAIAKELRPFLPEMPEGAEPPEEIAEMKKSHRYAYANRLAVEGLARDPLSAELAYSAGLASDFAYDPRVTRPWFDRFLAIRGIRAHDERTSRSLGRPLDSWELHALDEVQGSRLSLPR